MLLILITLAAVLTGLFLVSGGRLWAGIALPVVTGFVASTYGAVQRHVASVEASGASDPRSAGEYALQLTGNPIWLSALAIVLVVGVTTGVPAIRAKVFGRRAMKRAPKIPAAHTRSAPTNAERWFAAGQPERAFRGTITPELLAPLSAEITAPLDEWLNSLGSNTDDRRPTTDQFWSGLAASRLAGLTIPVEHGGLGLDPTVASTVVARAASRNIEAGEALAHSGVGGLADLIRAFGTDDQRASWLPRLARGEAIGALAFDRGREPARATVVRAGQGKKSKRPRSTKQPASPLAGLEVSLDAQAVEFAPIAGLFLAIVHVTDPNGVLGDVVDLGPTAIVLPAETKGVRVSEPYVAVVSGTPRGAVTAVEATIPMSQVLGGPSAVGGGIEVRAYSRECRYAWAAPALAAGVSQHAVRAACASYAVQDALEVQERQGATREIGRLCARAHTIEGLRRALAPRFMGVDGLDCGGSIGRAAKVAATRLAASVLEDAHTVLGERALFREPNSVLAGYGQYGRRLTHLFASNDELEREVLAPEGVFLALDGLEETDALRSEDAMLFDAYRWRRNERIAAHVVRASARRFVPRRSRRAGVDVTLAFVALSDSYGRLRMTFDPAERKSIDRDLGRALAGIVCFAARREVDRAGNDQPTERSLRELALEEALEDAARALFRASTVLGQSGSRACRLAARAARRLVAQRGAASATYEDVAREVLESHDVRSRMTAQVVVPGPEDPGLGALDRAARLVFAAKTPLERVEAARASGQVSGDFNECVDRATELTIISEVDRQNIRASRTSLKSYDSIVSGAAVGRATDSERRIARTG